MKGKAIAALSLALFAGAASQRLEKQKYGGNYPSHKQHATTLTCPKGYYLEDNRCITKQEVAEEQSCPPGSVESNGQCLNYSAGRYTCPSGLHLVGKSCVGRDTAEKERKCPAGSIARGEECIVFGDYRPECPADSTLENGRCAKIVQKFKVCPDGFNSIGDLCVRRDTEEPERFCPSGTIDDGRLCKITTIVEPVCPSGTEDLGFQCATYSEQVQSCPSGHQMVGSWCQVTETVQKTIECANGLNAAEGCAQVVPVPLTPICNIGKMWNGQCAQPQFTPVEYQCPADYQQNGNSCSKVTAYDCSTTEHDIVCEETPQGKGTHLRQLGEEAKEKYNTPSYGKRHQLPVCHKVPRNVPKTCERTITAQAEAFCTQGVLKAGNRCEIMQYTSPELVCNATAGPNGECFVTERSTPLRSCPDGYTNTGSSCTRTFTVAPEWSCPAGTEGPDCARYSQKSCPNGQCETTLIQPAKMICPEGFAKIKLTGKCLKLTYADKILQCPIGAEERDGLTCAEYFKQQVEDFVKRIGPQRVCPAGFADNGTQCVKRIVQPADFACPRDAQNVGSGCASAVPQISACPKGSSLLKDRCWVISTTEALEVDTIVSGKK